MNRTINRLLWPLAALILLWGTPVAMAQTGAAVVRPEPAALTVAAGQTQTVSVLLENAADVYGIDVRLSFDPALIEVVDADAARDGVQMTPGALPQPDFVALNAADNAAGALRYAVTQVNPTPPAGGSGVVFTFQVRGRASGVSPLRVVLVELANRSGELLSVMTRDGAVTVTGGALSAPTGVALTVPAEGAPATTAAAATVTPAPTVAAATTAAGAATSSVAPTVALADATTSPTGDPIASPQATLTAASGAVVVVAPTTVPGANDAASDAAPLPAEQTAPAAAGQTTTNPTAAPTAVAAAVDAPVLPSVIGAGTDATFPAATTPLPGDDSPGGALLIGGMTVLILVAVGVAVARRGRS